MANLFFNPVVAVVWEIVTVQPRVFDALNKIGPILTQLAGVQREPFVSIRRDDTEDIVLVLNVEIGVRVPINNSCDRAA